MKRIVFLGGSFNPPHIGHQKLLQASAQTVRDVEGVPPDLMLFIPAAHPPHKAENGMMNTEHRLAMCQLAAAEIGAQVSDIEINRQGKSYTADTLHALKEQYGPDCKLYLTVGSDMLRTLREWYQADAIFSLATICSNVRAGDDEQEVLRAKKELEQCGATVYLIKEPVPEASSTDIRRRIASGEPIVGLVPEPVAAYIRKNQLYRIYQ